MSFKRLESGLLVPEFSIQPFGVNLRRAVDVASMGTLVGAKPPAGGEIVCAVTRAAAPTGTGTANITTADLGGLTPKAVILIGGTGVTDGTAAAHQILSFGAATGASNEWAIQANTEDGQSTTDDRHEIVGDHCVLYAVPGTGTVLASAEFSAWIANGITLNWDVVDAAYLITAIFFAGGDLSAHANTVALGNVTDNAVDVTAPGFEPDLVIGAILQARNTGNGDQGGFNPSIGFCSNDGIGGVVQVCAASSERGGRSTTTECGGQSRNDSIVVGLTNTAFYDWKGVLGTFDANGFTVTTADAGANNTAMGYLALNFGGVANSWVGTHTTPTSGGSNGETGPGFQPQIALRVLTQISTVNTSITSGDSAGAFGFSAMDADEAYSTSWCDEDEIALGVSNAQSLSDDVAVQLPDDDGTAGLTAAFTSFDAGGWTENYTAVKGTGALVPALAIESI